MKKLIIAAVLSLSAVGAASAMTLSTGVEAQVQNLLPGADTSSLTMSQAAQISAILVNSGDDYSNDIDRRNAVRQVLDRG